MPHKYIIYGFKKGKSNGTPLGLATKELFDSADDAQYFIDQHPAYVKYLLQSEHTYLRIEKFHLHRCEGCNKDLLPEDRTCTIHLGVVNYRGTTLIGEDFDKIYCRECGDKLQVVKPEQVGSPVSMLQGKVELHCESMPCYAPIKLHGYCMMGGCEKIHNTIVRFGPIVGMQIVTEALRRYEPEYDMESLLEEMTERIVGTI